MEVGSTVFYDRLTYPVKSKRVRLLGLNVEPSAFNCEQSLFSSKTVETENAKQVSVTCAWRCHELLVAPMLLAARGIHRRSHALVLRSFPRIFEEKRSLT